LCLEFLGHDTSFGIRLSAQPPIAII
jgi:hypothetical protein